MDGVRSETVCVVSVGDIAGGSLAASPVPAPLQDVCALLSRLGC